MGWVLSEAAGGGKVGAVPQASQGNRTLNPHAAGGSQSAMHPWRVTAAELRLANRVIKVTTECSSHPSGSNWAQRCLEEGLPGNAGFLGHEIES